MKFLAVLLSGIILFLSSFSWIANASPAAAGHFESGLFGSRKLRVLNDSLEKTI